MLAPHAPSHADSQVDGFAPVSLSRRFGRRIARGLVAAALALPIAAPMLPSTADAMTVLKVPLRDLVGTSALILHAKVRSVQVRDRRKEGRAVWTAYDFDVLEVLKGDRKAVGARFELLLLGGSTADGMTLSVPGMPGFVAGEEVVILLERHSEGYTLTGAPQGKWTVYRDAKGVARVVRDLDHAHLVERRADGRLAPVPHGDAPVVLQPPRADETLAAFRARVLDLVRQTATDKAGASPAAPTTAPRALPRAPIGKRVR